MFTQPVRQSTVVSKAKRPILIQGYVCKWKITNDSRTADVGNMRQRRDRVGCTRLMTENSRTEFLVQTDASYLILTFRGVGEVCLMHGLRGWGRGKGCGANCKGFFPLSVAAQCQDLPPSPPEEQSHEVAAASLPVGQGSSYQFLA